MSLKLGQRVEISGKDCQGVVAYIGHPSFATGKWIGIILDEPKGKNNGTIKGQVYFKCPDNYGMFVRQSQLSLIDESGNRSEFSNSPGGASPASTVLAADDAGASRARNRLSRMSLSGSKAQESASSHENLTRTHTERKEARESLIPTSTSKRASFIETGFVETLKPQFVPGQAISSNISTGSVDDKISYQQIAQENLNLKAQIRDLSERIEALKVKRLQDKERLKDFEKMRIQLEQLIEFKAKVMESQASLQRELQRARQDVRDAHAAREQFQDEMAELSETVEMATLDKEMAEEKAETLQIELEQLKEKLEEQTLDLEILRTEMNERMSDDKTTSTGLTTFEMKQLEQQNIRLRETLVRMRDLSAHEKHEFQKLQKELDQKKSEITELGRTKEKLSSRIEEMEHQISDLQEQVDAALGAEEMVEVLVERKMALEEKVTELEEAVSDLEALQDMSDQLAESSKELEMELREELDLALAAARNAQRQRDAALETLNDRELTIQKFREFTKQLQEQCFQLQNRLELTESARSSLRGSEQQLAEILDFQKTFAETKAQTKAVDLELRRLDAEEARHHVNYLLSFMPAAFSNRGGDHDAILTLLFIPRMIQKTEILISQVQEKYKPVEKIDAALVLKDHAIAQSIFRFKLCSYMFALQTALSSFESSLKVCSTDVLLKIGNSYPEMILQEKALDGLIDLAKRDQLDENVSTNNIEKCCTYFFKLYETYFDENDFHNQTLLVINGTRCLGNACDAIKIEATSIKCLINSATDDISQLCSDIESICDNIQHSLKSARRKVPREFIQNPSVETNLGLEKQWFSKISVGFQNAVKILKILHEFSKECIQLSITRSDSETSLSGDKLKEIILLVIEKIHTDNKSGQIAGFRSCINVIQVTSSNLSDAMSECENEITINKNQHSMKKEDNAEKNPIVLRAQITRSEIEETKILNRKLEAKEHDLREAKLALRNKQEELSEMILRKDLAEKRYVTQQQEYELNIDKLKRNLEDVTCQLKRKEKEFEETMDHLQTDIDSLESEKGQLKEKLKSIGKKGPSIENTSFTTTTNVTHSSPFVNDNVLQEKLLTLQETLKDVSRQKNTLLNEKLHKKFDSMQPLPKINASWVADDKIRDLVQKKHQLLRDARKHAIFPVIPDLTKKKSSLAIEEPLFEKVLPAYHLFERETHLQNLNDQVKQLSDQVRKEVIKRQFGKAADTQLTLFQKKEFSVNLSGSKQSAVAEILIPKDGKSEDINMFVGTKELRKIHYLMCY